MSQIDLFDEIKMKLPVGIMEVDEAASMTDLVIEEDGIILPPLDKKYRYIGLFPIVEGGGFAPLCSEDGNKWTLCIGAKKDGKRVDLNDFQRSIEEQLAEWRTTE